MGGEERGYLAVGCCTLLIQGLHAAAEHSLGGPTWRGDEMLQVFYSLVM